MYLKHGTLNGRKFLSIAHNYRDPKTKKVRAKIIKTLGYLDELEQQYSDPITHFKQVTVEMNSKRAEEKDSLKIKINPNVCLEGMSRKNLGYAVLSYIYHTLSLDVFFSNNSRKMKVEYNVNSIMKTEIFSRILFPGSKKKTYDNREVFFENSDYELVDVYCYKTDSEIIEIYRGLWKIEESFKVTKSDFETRPVYLSRTDRIEAHFLICFIALVIIRILEKLLENKFSASHLAESLSRVSCSPLAENWYLFDYADEITAAIKEKINIDLTHKYLSLGEIKNILANTKK